MFREKLIRLVRGLGLTYNAAEVGAACLSLAAICLTERGCDKETIVASLETLIDEAIKNRATINAN